MATDITASSVPSTDAPPDHPLVNGDHAEEAVVAQDTTATGNTESFVENSALPTNQTAPNDQDKVVESAKPTEDVTSGIQGVADFVPKDASNLSHPTPPPEEPLVSSEANVDTEMADAANDVVSSGPIEAPSVNGEVEVSKDADMPSAGEIIQPAPVPETAAAPASAPAPETSLVRPREDDDEDAEEERATKRSKVEEPSAVPEPSADASTALPSDVASSLPETVAEQKMEPVANADAIEAAPPSAPAVNGASEEPRSAVPEDAAVPAATKVEADSSDVAPVANDVKPSVEEPSSVPASGSASDAQTDAPSAAGPKHSTSPMTPLQRTALVEKMKNLKKTKHSVPFLRPVDPVALNIPTYLDHIKQPMDLGTMDAKLKSNQYSSVQEFVNDFELVVHNTKKFNGDMHAVTQSAYNMQAYFNRMMETVPGPDQAAPAKAKRASPAVKPPPRREPRAAAAPAAVETQHYPVQANGASDVRRESIAVNRQARAIKPTQPREIPYAKPKRKEHQLELRFCQHVLDEIKSPKLAYFNNVFLAPVDPVALNIPHYRNVIKHPMDLGTMTQKLRSGEYGTSKDFQKDFELMINNCLVFNPQGNPVRDFGIGLKREFDRLWKDKEKWERQHRPESARATSVSADEDSDEEDDDEDPGEDEKSQTIKELQQQLQRMQSMITGIVDSKPAKPGKKAKAKSDKKKAGSMPSHALPKSRPAPAPARPKKPVKPKQVTYEEKQEISEAVNRMNEEQVQELTRIITENCQRYRDMEEMELEIDDLPNDVQALLLKYVRKLFGRPKPAGGALIAPDSPPDDGAAEDDEEYIAERGARGGGGGSKRKKHKPMSKQQQARTIAELSSKINQYDKVATSGSESPSAATYGQNHAAAESSGDEESEESEEE